MRISTRGEYGLRAMLVLAERQEGPCPLREIAEVEQISEQYLEQLFRDLRKYNLVLSFGSQGRLRSGSPTFRDQRQSGFDCTGRSCGAHGMCCRRAPARKVPT